MHPHRNPERSIDSGPLVLVTGGAGYVGCVLVPRLLQEGYRVRVLDRLVFGDDGLLPVKDRIDLIADDIRTVDDTIFAGVDAVIHLAGLSNDPTAEFAPEATVAINTQGTLRLARRAKAMGVARFVFASSCSVYYTLRPDDTERDERDSIAPEAAYSRSKFDAERGLLELADAAFCPIILRKGTIAGQSPRMRYDLVVNTFTKDAFSRRRLTVHARGQLSRPMLHIEDAIDAYVASLSAPNDAVCGGVFNLLSGNHTVLQLAQAVRRTLASSNIFIDLDVQQVGMSRSYRAAQERFTKAFGYRPQRDIASTVPPMWEFLQAGANPDHPLHYNIAWLELLVDMQRRLATMGGGPL